MLKYANTFGLLLVAALVFGASAASATTHTFDSEIEDTFITAAAVNNQVIVPSPGSGEQIECSVIGIKHTDNGKGEEVIDDGTLFGTTKEPSVYTATKLNVRFTYEGCEYVKHVNTKEEERVPAYVELGECYYAFENVTSETNHASVHIECPKGVKAHITITASHSACLALPEQTVSGISYNNNAASGSGRDFDITATIGGTTTEPEGTLCGSKKHTEGTYKGEVTISATNKNVGGSQDGIWIT